MTWKLFYAEHHQSSPPPINSCWSRLEERVFQLGSHRGAVLSGNLVSASLSDVQSKPIVASDFMSAIGLNQSMASDTTAPPVDAPAVAKLSTGKRFVAAAASAALATTTVNPFDVIKVGASLQGHNTLMGLPATEKNIFRFPRHVIITRQLSILCPNSMQPPSTPKVFVDRCN